MRVTIYHNPRCSKSRQTLELLERRGIRPVIVEYLKEPPDEARLSALLKKLDMGALDLMRRKEPEFLVARDELANMNEAQRLRWLAHHPAVIERPIVEAGARARLGRPPEAVLEILS